MVMLVEGIIVLAIAIILYMINTLLPPGVRAIAKIIGITLAVIGVVLIILAFVLGVLRLYL